ncbi:hypothetical protein FLX56_18240 [Synechococcus moorigangaii CMS01]|nr:hypothetical protein [Synechococcus moorigangaii CMS01]
MNSLSKLKNYDTDLIIKIRKRILSFDSSIKELKFSPSTFLFGRSKTNSCIDFVFSKERENYKLNIGFRLPLSFGDTNMGDKKIKFYRMVLDDRVFLRTKSRGKNEIIQDHLLLSQKALGKARVQRVTYASAYLRIFLCKELNLKSDRGWENKLARYCKERGLENPLMGSESLLFFFIDFSLGYYLQKI